MRSMIMRLIVSGLLVVFCLSLLASHNTIGHASTQLQAQIYWGASMSGSIYGPGYGDAPYDIRTWNLFESHAGKHVSILHWSQSWYAGTAWQGFLTQEFNTVRNRGAIPFLSWESRDACCGPNQSAFSLRNIANGAYSSYRGKIFDQFITSWADEWLVAIPLGHGTGSQSRCHDQRQHTTGLRKRLAARSRYFNPWGATNVTWVWCPNITSRHTTPIALLYPGNSYVDWTCLDGYNNSATNWQTFTQVFSGDVSNGFHNSYADITSLAPTKPLVLGEWASLEAGDGGAKKAAWITDALTKQLPTNYSKIKAVVWFNGRGLTNNSAPYQIESSKAAQAAFATAIASGYYASNTFASLNTSPIPPLA